MNKQEFLKLVEQAVREDLDYHVIQLIERKLAHNEQRRVRASWEVEDRELPVDGFYAIWEIGGMSGGNCWRSGEAQPYTADEPEAELDILDKFLEEHFPSLTHLTYRHMDRAVVQEEYTQSGYYGNYTTYGIKYLPFETVWQVLVDAGLVEADA